MNSLPAVPHCDEARAIADRFHEWLKAEGSTAPAWRRFQRRNAAIIRLDEWARKRGNPMGSCEIAALLGLRTHSSVVKVLRAHREATRTGGGTTGAGFSITETAEAMGLSRARICQIEKRALTKFRRRLAPLVREESPA